MGYWPAWHELDPTCIAIESLTDVSYAFASIDTDGSLHLSNDAGLRSWVQQKKHYPNLRIHLAVGGGTKEARTQFDSMAASPHRMDRFARSARETVDAYGLDGIDIDWEHPLSIEAGRQHLTLMIKLREALPQPYRLSTALPAGEWALNFIPLAALAKQIDMLNLMAYDFVGAEWGFGLTGHQAQLYVVADGTGPSGNAAVKHVIDKGLPAAQIMLGIPLYGRSFGSTNGLREPFQGAGQQEAYLMKDLPPPGMQETYDPAAVAVFAVGNGEFITYDNQESVAAKAKYVQGKGLAGLFYWQIVGDRCGEESIIRAGFRTLNPEESRFNRAGSQGP
jgi:chitinase